VSTVSKTPAELAPGFGGQLLQAADATYDSVRRVHNGLIDKRPAVIACCKGAADVADAVKLARELGLEIAVRGGGHNVAGRATVDGGVMIDLAPMQAVHVDARARTARAQGGVLWKGFNRETQLHGLATTGGVVSTTGIAGLTLGGGLGWLMPKFGLALDNLRSAELVLADGSVTHASADENPDLFWGIRGGGGNFGIATWLEYDVHPVGPVITGGLVAHKASEARAVLRFFRERCAQLPDEMMLVAGLLTGPDGSPLVGIVGAHSGDLASGEAAMQPIKKFGSPVLDAMGPIPYCALNSMLDDSYPHGGLNYWKAHFLTELSDEAIEVLIDRAKLFPTPQCQLLLEHFHGKATRVPVNATACTLRTPGYNAVIIGQWTDPKDTNRVVEWARDTYKALAPYLGSTRYMNYFTADEADPARAAYAGNYDRLREIKRRYDPDNVFHLNVNVQPTQ
jgi:FAD/FMN-containing dehydrogenase